MTTPSRPVIPGRLHRSKSFEIPGLAGKYPLTVYLPPGYERSKEYHPVAYMFDGQNLFGDAGSFSGGWHMHEALDALAASRVTTPAGMQVPLGEIEKLSIADGPAEIKSENGRLVGYVYVDIASDDLGGYVAAARDAVERSVSLPPGYAIQWAGQYIHLQHAKERLQWVVPLTLILVFLLLYLHFRHVGKVVLVMACLPLALVGGFWLVYALGYPFSVAVAVGFIALAGVAAEFGVVMLLYLDNAIDRSRGAGTLQDRTSLHEAIMEGALLRIRPKIMTVSVIIAGLLPILLGRGTGADVMKRIAAPLVGGMVSAALLSLIMIPVVYAYWHEKRLPPGR